MFKAIHEQTGVAWNSWKIWDAFENPKDKTKNTWLCCKLHKNPVIPIKKYPKKNGTVVASHFRALTDHFCPGESDEHWNLKVQIAEAIKNKQLLFSFKKENIQYEIDESIPLKDYLEVRKDNRQADVLLQFKERDSLLGFGIVIEIQITEKIESLESKAIDWIKHKFGITWIKEYPDSGIINIKYPMSLYFDIVRECNNLKWNKNKNKYRGDASW